MKWLNKFLLAIKLSLSSITTNKMRASLTAICIVIGIWSVTTMQAIVSGLDKEFQQSMEFLGTNVIFIEKWPWGLGQGQYKWWEYRNRREIDIKYLDQLKKRSSYGIGFSAAIDRNIPLNRNGNTVDQANVIGVTRSYQETSVIKISDGRFITDHEEQYGGNVCIIGNGIAEELFPDTYPIGESLIVRGKRLQVIGILEKEGEGALKIGGDQDNSVIIPISTFKHIFSLRRGLQLIVKFNDKAAVDNGGQEVEGIMRNIRNLDALEKNDFAINKSELFRKEIDSFVGTINIVGISLTLLSLFIGGIGVMNIMFISVKERTKEIGIRKSIGARTSDILFQFLYEAVAICCLGGIIGTLLSILTVYIINAFTPLTATLNWLTIGTAFLICSLIGLIFGLIPSRQASKANPIDALRYE